MEDGEEVEGEGEGKTDEGVECGDTVRKVSTEQARLRAQRKVSDRKQLEERKKLIELKYTQLQVVWALSVDKDTMFDGGKACADASEMEDDGRRKQKGRAIEKEEEEGG